MLFIKTNSELNIEMSLPRFHIEMLFSKEKCLLLVHTKL